MRDDYTCTNSHYVTYTFLFSKVVRMYFLFELGSERVKSHSSIEGERGRVACRSLCKLDWVLVPFTGCRSRTDIFTLSNAYCSPYTSV